MRVDGSSLLLKSPPPLPLFEKEKLPPLLTFFSGLNSLRFHPTMSEDNHSIPAVFTPPKEGGHLKKESIRDAVIRIAGNSQDGIQAVGGFLARLAGRSQQEVMTYMTIPSTISGGPSIFQVRMGSGDVLSAGDETDFLVALYQHSYENHIGNLKEGGVLLYDSDHVRPEESDRHKLVGISITGLTVEAIGGTSGAKGKNMLVLGLIAKIFDLDLEKLERLITERFSTKDESVLQNALAAFHSGYRYPLGTLLDTLYCFHPPAETTSRPQITMDGNQAMAYGLIAAGVRYGAAYPITPWTSVMEIMRAELPKYGGLFVQAEDELAAVAVALGFAYAGHLAVTGSSGPGISLKAEAVGWASMAEVPLLIVNVQRGGPSTGLPTHVEQSDLMQAIYGGHGDSPRVVLAAASVEDCFYLPIEAGKIAKKYSTPVFILSDASLSTRIEAFEEPDLASLMHEHTLDLSTRPADFKSYPVGAITQHMPPGAKSESGKYPVVTGLEHDEMGHPSGSPLKHTEMTAKRREKLRQLMKELPLPEVIGDESGELLLVGWGSSAGPIREAVTKMREDGHSVACVHLRHIHPLPEGLPDIFRRFKKVAVVEMNDQGIYGFGQLAMVLRAYTCDPRIESITKTDGLTYKVREIIQKVTPLLSGKNA